MAELALSNLIKNPERLKKLISKINDKSPFTKVKGDITKESDSVYLRFVHPSIEGILLKGPHNEISGGGKNQIFVETDASGKDKTPQKTFALSGLEKTSELGSSKGFGGGAEGHFKKGLRDVILKAEGLLRHCGANKAGACLRQRNLNGVLHLP